MAELRQLLEQAAPEHDAEVPLGEIRRRSRRRTAARVSGVAALVAAALVTVMTVTLPSSPESPPVVGEPNRPTAPDGEVPPRERDPATLTVGTTGMTWQTYLDQLTLVLRTVPPRGDAVDWAAARERLAVDEVDSDSDGYRAAMGLVRALGDRQTSFMDPLTRERRSAQATTVESERPSGRLLEEGVGYVVLPSTAGEGDVVDAYARDVREVLQDGSDACGWIVDLRRNGGGDSWAMVQGIAPLLGEGLVLRAVGPSGSVQATIEDDRLLLDGRPPEEWVQRPFEPIPGAEELVVGPYRPHPDNDRYRVPETTPTGAIDGSVPVAVVHDPETGSAGELTIIAMYGRPGPLRTFGATTAGITTAVSGYELVDGSRLFLPTHILGDRNGNSYEDALEPDVATNQPLEEAREWLADQPDCRP